MVNDNKANLPLLSELNVYTIQRLNDFYKSIRSKKTDSLFQSEDNIMNTMSKIESKFDVNIHVQYAYQIAVVYDYFLNRVHSVTKKNVIESIYDKKQIYINSFIRVD